MSPHTLDRSKQRIPFTLYDDDIPLFLRLKHKMELEANQKLTTTEILKIAIHELARQHGINS